MGLVDWKRLRGSFFFTVTLFCIVAPGPRAQTVLDLSSIEPDVQIVGSEGYSYLCRSTVLDLDDSGRLDLVVVDEAYQSQYQDGQCVFVFLDFSENQPEPVINMAEGGYDLVIAQYPGYGHHLRVITVGDWNHDGINDLALADPMSYEPNYIPGGTVYVFWGGNHWQSGDVVYLSVDQPDIFINSSDFTDDPELGYAMAALDFNNDGIDDLAVSGRYATNQAGGNPGAVYVIYGSDSFPTSVEIDTTLGDQDLTIYGQTDWGRFGTSLSAGDVNGDGIDDLVVGAPQAWFDDDDYGAVYVVFGSESFPPHHVIDLAQADADVTVIGSPSGGNFGRYATCGDFNGDTISDICIGEHTYSEEKSATGYSPRGAAHLLWGDSSFQSGTVIDLRTTMADVMFLGELDRSYLGEWVSSGDLNNDGLDELSISCVNTTENPLNASGGHYIFHGSLEFPPNFIVDLSKVNPSILVVGRDEIEVSHDLNFFQMVDINGDGFRDLMAGHGFAYTPETNSTGVI